MKTQEEYLEAMRNEPDPYKRAELDGRRLAALTAEDWAREREGWVKPHLLTGAKLDYWVARAEGLPCVLEQWMTNPPKPAACWLLPEGAKLPDYAAGPYSPSTNWAQGGPIIERERIRLDPDSEDGQEGEWYADTHRDCGRSDAPLIAAMRAYVASKFGREFKG